MTTATTATSLAPSHAISWDPDARVPDWVVLGRIRDLIPALLAAGHKHHEIERATGVKPSRHLPRRTR